MVVVAGGRSSAPMDWRWGRRNEWREREREREMSHERQERKGKGEGRERSVRMLDSDSRKGK